jgi:hypothetical protein
MSQGGGGFPFSYLVVAFLAAAVFVAILAYWAGRRRGASGRGPASTPDAPPERHGAAVSFETSDESGPRPG